MRSAAATPRPAALLLLLLLLLLVLVLLKCCSCSCGFIAVVNFRKGGEEFVQSGDLSLRPSCLLLLLQLLLLLLLLLLPEGTRNNETSRMFAVR